MPTNVSFKLALETTAKHDISYGVKTQNTQKEVHDDWAHVINLDLQRQLC